MPDRLVVAPDRAGTFEFGFAAKVFGLPRPEPGPDRYRLADCASGPATLRATTRGRCADQLSAAYPDMRVEPNVPDVDEGAVLTSAGNATSVSTVSAQQKAAPEGG
jgi:hypothetical protein